MKVKKMIKAICFFYFLTASLVFADDGKLFVYNEKGKEDPFRAIVAADGSLASSELEKEMNDLVLEGIVSDTQGHNLAILNGKVVKVGDIVTLYTVESISTNQVELSKGAEHLTVKIKKVAF